MFFRVAALVLCVAPSLVHAHHPNVMPVRARSDVRVGLQLGLFDMAGVSGHLESVVVGGDLLVLPRLAVGLQGGLHILSIDGAGTEIGLSDSAAVVTVQILTQEDLLLAAQATVEAPTGDHDRGLGAGHVEAALGAGAQLRRGSLAGTLALSYVHSLGESHEHATVQPVDPHDGRQLEVVAGIAWAPSWFVGLSLQADVPLIEHEGPAVRLIAGVEGGLQAGHHLVFRLGLGAGLNDERPYDLRVGLSAEWAPGRAR